MFCDLNITISHVNVQSEGVGRGGGARADFKYKSKKSEATRVLSCIWFILLLITLFSVFVSMTCMMKDDLFTLLKKKNAPPWFYTQITLKKAAGWNNEGSLESICYETEGTQSLNSAGKMKCIGVCCWQSTLSDNMRNYVKSCRGSYKKKRKKRHLGTKSSTWRVQQRRRGRWVQLLFKWKESPGRE